MILMPDVPTLIVTRDYAQAPCVVSESEHGVLMIARHPLLPAGHGRPRVDPRVVEFITPEGVPLLTGRVVKDFKECVLERPDGSRYGTVNYRRVKYGDGIYRRYEVVHGEVGVLGGVFFSPLPETDPRLGPAVGPSYFTIRDAEGVGLGQLFAYGNHWASRRELRFAAPAATDFATLCAAAEVMAGLPLNLPQK